MEGNRYHRLLYDGEVAGEERTRRGENSRLKWQAVRMMESESHGAAMGCILADNDNGTVPLTTSDILRSELICALCVMGQQFHTGCDLHRVTVCLLGNSLILLVLYYSDQGFGR